MFAYANIFCLKANILFKNMKKKESNLPQSNFADAVINLQKEHGLLDSNTITIIKPNKAKEKEKFVKVFQLGLNYFLKSLSPSGCKLFMYFMSISEYGNFVEVDQKEIQETLGIRRTALNKGLKELQEINVIKIIHDTNDKRRNTYVINHHVVWKGNPGDRMQSIKLRKEHFINPYQLSLELKQNK